MFKSLKVRLGLLVGALVFALVGVLAVVNFTQTASAAPATQAKSSVTIPPAAQAQVDQYNQLLQSFRKDFADKLGVSESKLDQAFSGAVADSSDTLVKDGKLSEQQAASIKAIASGGLSGLALPLPQSVIDQFTKAMPVTSDQVKQLEEKVATTLGVSTTELETQVISGKSLADIAAAHNVSLDTLKQTLTDGGNSILSDAVKSGKLTQAQADQFSKVAPMLLDKLVSARFNGQFSMMHK